MSMSMLVAANAAAQGLVLSAEPFVQGVDTDLVVTGLNQGETTRFYRAAQGVPGPCLATLGGLCLDVGPMPRLIGSAVADAAGVATLAYPVPAGAPVGASVAVQAVARRGAGGSASVESNVVQDTVAAPPICPVYADPTVLPGGDGSAADPYPTIAYAIALRDPSCTEIVLYPGTYDENVDYGADDLQISSTDGREATVITSIVGGDVVRIAGGQSDAARLEGVTMSCTSAAGSGVALVVDHSSPTVRDVVVEGCDASGSDGGTAWWYAGGSLSDSLVRDNGFGLYAGGSTTTFTGNRIEGTSEHVSVNLTNGSPAFVANEVVGNREPSTAESVVLYASAALFANNLLADNRGAWGIAVIQDAGSLVAHNTVATASVPAAWFEASEDAVVVANVLVRTGGAGYTVSADYQGMPDTWADNDVYPASYYWTDLTGIDGNIGVDPLFVGGGDYRLQWGSACIDAASDGAAVGVVDDLDGTARPQGLGHDIGAYESW